MKAEQKMALIADCQREIDTLTDHIVRMKKHHAPFDLSRYESQLKRQQIALAALTAPPDGWKLVPVEPTAAMYEAGDRHMATKQVWDAMLAAAPEVV
ncbi:hypothetical protein ACKVM9_002867 [Pantoea agglomerans]|uniref:hypothetical protein n=1 Tax=Enterobacter agglomerans TaxID=549 RepID=UPI003909694F